MQLSKTQIQSLTWPKGATHLRVTTADGKTAVATKRSAPVSLEGVEGEFTFGVVAKDGKKEAFKALPNAVTEPVVDPVPAVPVDGAPVAKKSTAKAKAPKREGLSKCAFIDTLYTSGTAMMQKDMLTLVIEKYPDANPESTMKTIMARPGHIRKAGGTPVWTPDPEARKGGGHKERGPKRIALDAILDPELDPLTAKPAVLRELLMNLRRAHAPEAPMQDQTQTETAA